MNTTLRVLVATNEMPEPAITLLKEKFDVTVLNSSSPSTEEILKVIPNYDAIMGKVYIDRDFLDKAGNRLKVVSTASAGYDHMDVSEIKKRGIKVGNTPKVLSATVAEIAIYLLLGTIRRAHEGRKLLEQGKVVHKFQWLLGHDLQNKTIGIVGFGNIGEAIAKRLIPFEIKKILYFSRNRKPAGDKLNAEFVPRSTLLKESDVIFNCLPLNKQTEKIFDNQVFEQMKNTAVFVNIGRGKTVDTDALVRALKNNTIFAAGLDVTDPEPLPVDHELMKLPNALVIPHMGSQTIETRTNMAIAAAENIINGLEGKPLRYEL